MAEIWMSPDKAAAEPAIKVFCGKYGAQHPIAGACLEKDPEALLAFHDFPAGHLGHLHTTSSIESVFSTVRHRIVRAKVAPLQEKARLMVFKLVAARTWRKLKGENFLPGIVQGVRFANGIEVEQPLSRHAA